MHFTVAFKNFNSPCQVELFWIVEPIEGQAIVVTHDRDRPDKEIIVNGPFRGDEFIGEVAAVSKEERWQQSVPPQNYRTPPGQHPDRSDVLASIIASFVGRLEQSIFNDFSAPDVLFLNSRRLWDNSSSHLLIGNVVKSDISAETDEKSATGSNKNDNESSKADDNIGSESSDQDDGKEEAEAAGGGFIYPAVWVDKAPERSFEEKVRGSHFPENEIAFRGGSIG